MPIRNNTDQENTDQENADQEKYWPKNFWSGEMLIRKNTDQENADQENADQEKYWSAKLSLCTSVAVLASPSSDVANLFSQKVNQSIKKSTSQSTIIVVYLCDGSGKSVSRCSQFVWAKKSTSQSKVNQSINEPLEGVLTAGKPYIPAEVGGQWFNNLAKYGRLFDGVFSHWQLAV